VYILLFSSYVIFHSKICTHVIVTVDRLTLNTNSATAVTWSNCVPNFNEIEQTAVELWGYKDCKFGGRLYRGFTASGIQSVRYLYTYNTPTH